MFSLLPGLPLICVSTTDPFTLLSLMFFWGLNSVVPINFLLLFTDTHAPVSNKNTNSFSLLMSNLKSIKSPILVLRQPMEWTDCQMVALQQSVPVSHSLEEYLFYQTFLRFLGNLVQCPPSMCNYIKLFQNSYLAFPFWPGSPDNSFFIKHSFVVWPNFP
jgi:hypothetical protein